MSNPWNSVKYLRLYYFTILHIFWLHFKQIIKMNKERLNKIFFTYEIAELYWSSFLTEARKIISKKVTRMQVFGGITESEVSHYEPLIGSYLITERIGRLFFSTMRLYISERSWLYQGPNPGPSGLNSRLLPANHWVGLQWLVFIT